MNKKILSFFLLVIVLILVSACSGESDEASSNGNDSDSEGTDSGETYTLKLASIQPETHTMTKNFFKPFMERVEELTDGQIKFEFYPAEQLGKASDYLDLTRDGVMDVAYYLSTYYPSHMPISANLYGIPGVYETAMDSVAAHKITKQEPILTTDFLNNGVRPVSTFLVPSYQFWTTGKEVKVPSDLEGEKVRAPGGIATKALEALGAAPVSTSSTEVYEAVDRGVLDILNWYGQGVRDYGLGELVKYGVVNADFGGLSGGLVINETLWQELPQNLKDAITQAGNEVAENFGETYEADEQAVYEEFANSGEMEIYELNDSELKEWQEFYDEFRDPAIDELEVSEELREALDQFNEELGN